MFILVNNKGVMVGALSYQTIQEATAAASNCVQKSHFKEIFICTPVRRVTLPPQDIIIEDLLQT